MRFVCILLMVLLLIACLGSHAWSETLPAARPAGLPITTNGILKRNPVFWPERNELVYTVESQKTGRMRLVRRNLESGLVSLLFEDEGRSDREFSVSADGGVYAFNVVRGLSSKIMVIDTIRDRRITIPQIGEANWANWPCVSPDASQLVFTEGASVIYSYDLVQNKGKQSVTRFSPLGSPAASDYWPRFSADGEQIVFVSNRDDDFEIYSMSAGGTNQRRLTQVRGIDMRPAYCPDGSHIAFTSNRDGNYEIYIMRADGSNPRRLTQNEERDDYACWHPNGRDLVFVSERGGQFDLYQVNVLGEAAQ